jgi:hypothetical protein
LANTTEILTALIQTFSRDKLEEPSQTSSLNQQESILDKQEDAFEDSISLEKELTLILLQSFSKLIRYGKDAATFVVLWAIILGPVVAILSTIPMTAVVFVSMYLTPLLDVTRIREWVFPEYPLPAGF